MSCWKPRESPPAPACHFEFPPPSTPALVFDEEDPLSRPEGNIATSSEPIAGESPAAPTFNSEDVPPDGKPVPSTNSAIHCLF